MQERINGESPHEEQEAVREDCASAAAFVCRSEEGRKRLMAAGGHESLKKGYEFEEHGATMAAMEAAARLLMGVSLEAGDEDPGAGGIVMMG